MPASPQESESAALVDENALVRQQWRWFPLRSTRPSQTWRAWSPLQCLPAVSDLMRLSARSKARSKEPRAILATEGAVIEGGVPFIARDAQQPEINETAENCLAAPASEVRGSCASMDERPIVHSSSAHQTEEGATAAVVLDVGFAQIQFKRSKIWPKCEFYIEARDEFITRDGAAALLEYLDFVLHLPDVVSTGFVLTYDLRKCACPQLDLVSWIMHYISDPEREDLWHERCVCWKVVTSPGMYFTMAQSALSFLFKVYPPKCRVFLLTDPDTTKAESWICYRPEDLQQASLGMLSTIGNGFLEALFPAYPYKIETLQSMSEIGADANACEASNTLKPAACRDSLTTSFATITQGFDNVKSTGYLKIVGHDAPVEEEGLGQIMDFMDNFVDSENARHGFSITYDARHLSVPSMSVIMRVAEWGKHPERQATWTKLNTSCKIVISAGLRFSICKGALKSFFYMCPPVCRTFLLTDPDEPEDAAVIFEPTETFQKREEDSHSEGTPSDDGSSCGHSVGTSEATSASTTNSLEVEVETKGTSALESCDQRKLRTIDVESS